MKTRTGTQACGRSQPVEFLFYPQATRMHLISIFQGHIWVRILQVSMHMSACVCLQSLNVSTDRRGPEGMLHAP
jgi:hypothetical protein